MPLDPEDLIADWQQRAEQQAALTTELSRRMQQSKASAESPDGEVVVTVDHVGGLTDLKIKERATRLPTSELASIILETNRRAQATVARQVAEMVKGLYGSDSETAAFIAGAYAEQFPEQGDDEERERS